MAKKKLHVVVLVPELREIAADDDMATLATGKEVAKHYEELGYTTAIEHFEFDPETFKKVMRKAKADCVFNLVESVYARSRLLNLPPVYLEELRLPYTGADSSAMFTTNDKVLAKSVLRMLDVPTPDLFMDRHAKPKGAKWIVKARHEHASFGITQDNVVEGTTAACALADKLTDKHDIEWIIEEFVDGREFNTSIIETRDGPRVLPIAEIKFLDYENRHKIVDYKAKWDDNSFESVHTVRSYDHPKTDKRVVERMADIALKVWNGFGMNGWGRLDFRVDEGGTPYVVDINANPDISLDAGFMAAAGRAGISPPEAIAHITDAALRAAANR